MQKPSKLLIACVAVAVFILTMLSISMNSSAKLYHKDGRGSGEKVVVTLPNSSAPSPKETATSVLTKKIIDIEDVVTIPLITNPYSSIELSDYDKELLAKMVYNEARGEEFDGQVAVALVALNRCLHEAFPDDIAGVLLAPNQFSVGSTYTEAQMEAVEVALAGATVFDLNTDVVFFSTGNLKYGSYYDTIGRHVFRTYN